MATETMGLLSNSKGKRVARAIVALQALGLVLALALTMHCALAAWDLQFLPQTPSMMVETTGGSSSGRSDSPDASAHSHTEASDVVTTESINEPVTLAYDTRSTRCEHLGGE